MASLVLTVVGDDQSGLVGALAEVIAGSGGSWDKSQMAQLGGKFAGIVLVSVPDHRADELLASLEPLESEGLLDITAVRATAELPAPRRRFALELVGHDHRGIVHDIAAALAAQQVSIGELKTATSNAPMAGGILFHASAILTLPDGLALDDLRARLEDMANELMVDIDLHEETQG